MENQSHLLWNDIQLAEEENPFAFFPNVDYFDSVDDFSSTSFSIFESWDLHLLQQQQPPFVNHHNSLLDPYPLPQSSVPDYSFSSFDLDLELNNSFGFEDYLYQLDLFQSVSDSNNVTCHHFQQQDQNQMLSAVTVSNENLAISDKYGWNQLMKVEDNSAVDIRRKRRMAGAAKRSRLDDYDGDDGCNKAMALSREVISEYFYMPITQAAKEMNIGLTLLKKRCREVGIRRWPHRKLMSLQTLINNVQEMGDGKEEKSKVVIEMLEREMKLMEDVPDRDLGTNTKKLRQACFKANYKKRKLIGMAADSWSSLLTAPDSPGVLDDANETKFT